MKKSHYEWQKRVLNETKYMVVTAMNETSLCGSKKEALAKIGEMPKYRSPKLYKKVDPSTVDIDNNETFTTLRGLSQLEMIGAFKENLRSMFIPVHSMFHRTLFISVS